MEGDVEGWAHDYSSRLLALPFSFLFFFSLAKRRRKSFTPIYIYIYTCTNSRQFGRYLRAFLPQMLFIDEKRKESGKERERDRSFVFKHAVKNWFFPISIKTWCFRSSVRELWVYVPGKGTVWTGLYTKCEGFVKVTDRYVFQLTGPILEGTMEIYRFPSTRAPSLE